MVSEIDSVVAAHPTGGLWPPTVLSSPTELPPPTVPSVQHSTGGLWPPTVLSSPTELFPPTGTHAFEEERPSAPATRGNANAQIRRVTKATAVARPVRGASRFGIVTAAEVTHRRSIAKRRAYAQRMDFLGTQVAA